MSFFKVIGLLGLMFLSAYANAEQTNVLKLGYKEDAKPPLIGSKDDNTGAFSDLLNIAAEKIGYKIVIDRKPKKRIHSMLEAGETDFYPGGGFEAERAHYLYYFDMGFKTSEICITRDDLDDIADATKVKNMILLAQVGGSSANFDKENPNITIHTTSNLDIAKTFSFLLDKKVDLAFADIEPFSFYIKNHPKSLTGLKIHKNCLGGEKPLYILFSRKSPLFKENPNPKYNAASPISPKNFPTIIDSNSVAGKFAQALSDMQKSGESQKIYNKYFK